MAAFVTLSALEIVLGIDNVVFISILVSRMEPKRSRPAVRQFGLLLALIMRIMMLFGLTWLIGLTTPVVSIFGQSFSWHDIILIGGGLFLIAKATHEIHREIEPIEEEPAAANAVAERAFGLIVAQVVAVDLMFSINSIITAIGMVQDIRIMIAAVLVAVAAMYFASGAVASFIAKHPTTKMLALGLSGADRRRPAGRRLRIPYSARIHLFCHGIRDCRGDGQYSGAAGRQTRRRRLMAVGYLASRSGYDCMEAEQACQGGG